MALRNQSKIEKSLKRFLIVGERLDGIHTFNEYHPTNLLVFIVLLVASVFTSNQAIISGSFWYLLSTGFYIGSFYYILNFRSTITYAITKFRIIRVVEGNLITRKIFRSSRLVGFTDLHYEHVESINVGSPTFNITRLYISIIIVILGWLSFENLPSYTTSINNIEQVIALIFVVTGIINILFSMPIGGVRLILHSISGDSMEFPEKYTPADFIDDLILNCRTFLSYGAV